MLRLVLKPSLYLLLLMLANNSADAQFRGPPRPRYTGDNIWYRLHRRYDEMGDRSKLIVGGVAGYIGSRMLIKSAVGAIKVAGIAFLTTEVLHYSGVTVDLPALSNEQADLIKSMRNRTLRTAENVRASVHKRLNPMSVQSFIEQEKVCAMGLAGGAFIGLLL